MAQRIDGLNQNREIIKPKIVEPKVQNKQIVENRFQNETDKNLFLRQNNLGAETLKLSILAKFSPDAPQNPANPTTPPTADPKKIEDAVKTIKESLSQGITDWDVTRGDLENIEKTFKNLNAEEANRTFEQLSDDDLKNWVQELNGVNGSYNSEEKSRLFNDLAGKLDAQNLTRLAENLGLGDESSSVRPGQKDAPDVNLLADAIAKNSPDNVKAEFVKLMADKADKHQDAGAAVAQVLTSLKNNPALLNRTLSQLSDSQLQSIIDGAARKTTVSTRGGSVTNYDPEPLAELLNAVSTLQGDGAAKQKARIFEAAANKLTEIRENATAKNVVPFGGSMLYHGQPAENMIRDGLTKIMDSDTENVVRSLKENFVDGSGLTAYVKSLINSGDNKKIGEMIARLSKGNDLQGDALTRFGQKTADDDANRTQIYSNAQVLGYFGGSVLAATRQVSGDAAKQAETLKNIFGTITGGIGAVNTPLGVSGAIINGLSSGAVVDITTQLSKGKIKDAEAMQKLLIPREVDGSLYRGETEKGEFINWSDHVVVSNP